MLLSCCCACSSDGLGGGRPAAPPSHPPSNHGGASRRRHHYRTPPPSRPAPPTAPPLRRGGLAGDVTGTCWGDSGAQIQSSGTVMATRARGEGEGGACGAATARWGTRTDPGPRRRGGRRKRTREDDGVGVAESVVAEEVRDGAAEDAVPAHEDALACAVHLRGWGVRVRQRQRYGGGMGRMRCVAECDLGP
jgi:hypothetical protein